MRISCVGGIGVVISIYLYPCDNNLCLKAITARKVIAKRGIHPKKMVASAVFITDLSGKAIISRDYRGDVPLTKAIEIFVKYLTEVEDELKKPMFQVDTNGDVMQSIADVGSTGPGGETFIYIQVGFYVNFISFP